MNKLDKEYEEYQELTITDKLLIEDFLKTHIPLWEKDILKFDNFKSLLTKENINNICFYSYIGLNEELEYQLIFNDKTIKNFYLDKEIIYKWLTNHDLIK